jgi:stress-induced morphogen
LAAAAGAGIVARTAVWQPPESVSTFFWRHISASLPPGVTPAQCDMKSERQFARSALCCALDTCACAIATDDSNAPAAMTARNGRFIRESPRSFCSALSAEARRPMLASERALSAVKISAQMTARKWHGFARSARASRAVPTRARFHVQTNEELPAMAMDAGEIERLIKASIPDAQVTIRDLAGDGDHYAATVVSAAFKGKSRVQQHQLVYQALKGQMGGVLHALALQTAAPESA